VTLAIVVLIAFGAFMLGWRECEQMHGDMHALQKRIGYSAGYAAGRRRAEAEPDPGNTTPTLSWDDHRRLRARNDRARTVEGSLDEIIRELGSEDA